MDLSVLDASYKGILGAHLLFLSLCLQGSSTWRHRECYFLLKAESYSIMFVRPFGDGPLGSSYLSAVVNNTAVNIHVPVFV